MADEQPPTVAVVTKSEIIQLTNDICEILNERCETLFPGNKDAQTAYMMGGGTASGVMINRLFGPTTKEEIEYELGS